MATGRVGSAGVGVVAAQVAGDGVNHALRDLRSAGAVEEDGGMSVDGLGESGELRADIGEVEGGGSEGLSVGMGSLYIMKGAFRSGPRSLFCGIPRVCSRLGPIPRGRVSVLKSAVTRCTESGDLIHPYGMLPNLAQLTRR